MMTTSETGTVKWFNAEKGFGFIAPDSGGNDVFVHAKQVQQSGLDSLHQDQKVSFVRKPGRPNDNRLSAHEIRII
jgi:cold shock protein